MDLSGDSDPVYPSTYFQNEVKPKAVVKLKKTGTIEKYRMMVMSAIIKDQSAIEVGTTFLVLLMKQKPFRLEKDWMSFKTKIGSAGELINIEAITDITYVDAEHNFVEEPEATKELDQALALFLLLMYRFGNITNETYLDKLLNNFAIKVELTNNLKSKLRSHTKMAKSYIANSDFCKIVASIDMFLYHFPKHEYQDFRIGSISVRHKDCAALQSITYFKSQHGITVPRFARWLWVTCLATEFCRIFKEGNEIDQPGSYMPYFMELKLSTKSPYSTTMNPNIHYFIHCVGSA